MDKYPDHVRNIAKPLVFLTGIVDHEPEIHSKLMRCFETSQRELDQGKEAFVPTYKEKELLQHISYRVVPPDYSYLEKKPPKDFINTEGIMKHNWSKKHYESIPSALVYVVPFGVEWNQNEFARREAAIQERYSRYRQALNSRDTKVIMVCVRVGVGYMEKELVDERLNVLKKHAQLDSKNFLFVHVNEVNPDNVALKRLHKQLRDYSYAYYAQHIKRFKAVEKSISERFKGLTEYILLARYNFKVAYLNEFTGHRNYMIKYYRNAYSVLLSSLDSVDEEMYEQTKILAEHAHFKLITLFILQGQYEEMSTQFKMHSVGFAKIYSELAYRHYAWLADQHHIYAQLLTAYNVQTLIGAPGAAATALVASGELELSHYYLCAARYSQKRETSFSKSFASSTKANGGRSEGATGDMPAQTSKDAQGHTIYKGLVFLPPKYVGSPPQVLDAIEDHLYSAEEAARVHTSFIQDCEDLVDHSAIVLQYLHISLRHLSSSAKRRKALVYYTIADHYLRHEVHTHALPYLWHALSCLHRDHWDALVVQSLRGVIASARALQRGPDLLLAGLYMYAYKDEITVHEREDLHCNLFHIMYQALGRLQDTPTAHDDDSRPVTSVVSTEERFMSSTFAPWYFALPEREPIATPLPAASVHIDNYQSALQFMGNAVQLSQDEMVFSHTRLPSSIAIHLPPAPLPSPLTVRVEYSKAAVELGEELVIRVFVDSLFVESVVFDKAVLSFSDGALEHTFVHGPITDLTVAPGVCTTAAAWELSICTTEDVFGKLCSPDTALYLQRVDCMFTEGDRSVCLSVPALALALQEDIERSKLSTVQGPRRQSIRDMLQFHSASMVVVNRPSSLLSLRAPSAAAQPTLFQGLVQRIDVQLQVGPYALRSAQVYLHSDLFLPPGHPSFFWSPRSLSLGGSEDSVGTDGEGEGATFHPMVLNPLTSQPAHPLAIAQELAPHSVVTVPLFFCPPASALGVVTVKLTVECVAAEVMQTALARELLFKVEVARPFESAAHVHPTHPTARIQQPLLVPVPAAAAEAPCVEIAGDEDCVLSLHLQARSRHHPALVLSHTYHRPLYDFAEDRELLGDVATVVHRSADRPTVLCGQEAMQTTLWLHVSGNAAQRDAVAMGHVEVRWRLRDHRPMRSAPALVLPGAAANAVQAGDPAALAAYLQCLDTQHARTEVADYSIAIPRVKVARPSMSAWLEAPEEARMLQPFSVRVRVRNALRSMERVQLVVFLSESFLLSGPTSATIEVAGRAEESVELRCVALRPGPLAFPQVRVTWERQGARLLDLGEREAGRRQVFVQPAEVDRALPV